MQNCASIAGGPGGLSRTRRDCLDGAVPIDPAGFFLVLGLILIASELLVPGLVVSFLGAAALLVSAGLALGLVSGWLPALTAWFISSLVLVVGVRNVFTRFLPGSSVKQLTDEDLDAFGEVVEVVETVTTRSGRIRFRGSTWAAQSLEGELPSGTRARVVTRDNLIWIVEPAEEWPSLPAPDNKGGKS